MKKPFLIAVALLVAVAAIFFANRPKETPAARAPDSVAPSSSSAGKSQPFSPAKTAPAPAPRLTKSSPQPKPIPKELQDPRALDPEPLKLSFGRPPFERQKNGTIFKRDVIDSLSDLNDENRDPVEDVQQLTSVVNAFRTIFKENPVAGENHEVVEALTGKNVYNLVFVDPGHPAINANGELVDRWGVPYRFHPIARDLMEISSAGEDREFGTGDDVIDTEPIVIGDTGPES